MFSPIHMIQSRPIFIYKCMAFLTSILTDPQKSAPCITAIGYNGVQLWQNEGFVSGEVLASTLEKAWLSIHVQETTATFLTAALASRQSEQIPSEVPATVSREIGSSSSATSTDTNASVSVDKKDLDHGKVKNENHATLVEEGNANVFADDRNERPRGKQRGSKRKQSSDASEKARSSSSALYGAIALQLKKLRKTKKDVAKTKKETLQVQKEAALEQKQAAYTSARRDDMLFLQTNTEGMPRGQA